MKNLTLNDCINKIKINDYIDNKLKEAEEQMETTNKRYSKEEFLEKINNIINQYENNIF